MSQRIICCTIGLLHLNRPWFCWYLSFAREKRTSRAVGRSFKSDHCWSCFWPAAVVIFNSRQKKPPWAENIIYKVLSESGRDLASLLTRRRQKEMAVTPQEWDIWLIGPSVQFVRGCCWVSQAVWSNASALLWEPYPTEVMLLQFCP